LTPRKKKLCNMIWTRESALCKVRKKYRAKKLKEICQLDSNPLIQSLSSSLNVDTSRFLAFFVRNGKHEPKDRRWSSKEKVLAVSILKCSSRSYAFLQSLFPQPYRRTLQSLLITAQFRTCINSQLGVSEKTPFFRFCDQEIAAVFDPPCLLKCTCNLFLKHDMTNVGLGVVVNGQ
jgi:hypothetical protein